MPANLNALIRYKTINSCLYGGRRRWSISELIRACSEALAEARGRYDPVSERTIRDDIRVMRSDILGFNAPIKQKKGLYYYSDPGYSIMSVSITDSGLAEQIIKLLTDLRPEVSHPELEKVLERLMKLTGKEYVKPAVKEAMIEEKEELGEETMFIRQHIPRRLILQKFEEKIPGIQISGQATFDSHIQDFMVSAGFVQWGDIMGIILV